MLNFGAIKGGFGIGQNTTTNDKYKFSDFTSQTAANVATGNTGGYDSKGFGAVVGALKVIPVYGQALAIIEGLIGKGTINNTLGAIFANNFDFSCWGSAGKPSSRKGIIEEISAGIKAKLQSITGENIQDVINDVSAELAYHRYRYVRSMKRKKSWAKCTKKAWQMHTDAFQKMHTDVLLPLLEELRKAGFIIKETESETVEQYLEDLYNPAASSSNTTAEKNNKKYGGIMVPVYTFSIKESALQQGRDEEDLLQDSPSFEKSEAGFGFVGVAILIALALGMKKFK